MPHTMKKTIAIILISICHVAQAQQGAAQAAQPKAAKPQPKLIVFEKPDDIAYHVWAGMAINWATGSIIYAKTKNTTAALIGGFVSAVAVGIIKEAVWDGAMKRGVCNNNDAYATFWGAAVGTVTLRIGIDVHERKQYDKEYFDNLGPGMRVVDTLVVSPGDTTFLVERKIIDNN